MEQDQQDFGPPFVLVRSDEINWEGSLHDAATELNKLVPRGVSVEYRCSTCRYLASFHENNNVKGCKGKRLEGQALRESLEEQTLGVRQVIRDLSQSRALELERDTLVEQVEELQKELKECEAALGRRPPMQIGDTASGEEFLHGIGTSPPGSRRTIHFKVGAESVNTGGSTEDDNASSTHVKNISPASTTPDPPASLTTTPIKCQNSSFSSIISTTSSAPSIPLTTAYIPISSPPGPTLAGLSTGTSLVSSHALFPSYAVGHHPASFPATLATTGHHPASFPAPLITTGHHPASFPATLATTGHHPASFPAPLSTAGYHPVSFSAPLPTTGSYPHPPVVGAAAVSSAAVASAPPPGMRFPGLFDTTEPIFHCRGGPILGGNPSGAIVRSSRKDVTQSFKKNDTASKALLTQQFMMTEFSLNYSDADIYTIVAIFVKSNPELKLQVAGMIKKEAHFTSFEHFLRELQEDRFPDLKYSAEIEMDALKEKGDGALALYLHFDYLCKQLGRNPNDYVRLFLSKLRHEVVRDTVNKANFTREQRYDLHYIAAFCDSLQTRLNLSNKIASVSSAKAKSGKNDAVSSSNNSNNDVSNDSGAVPKTATVSMMGKGGGTKGGAKGARGQGRGGSDGGNGGNGDGSSNDTQLKSVVSSAVGQQQQPQTNKHFLSWAHEGCAGCLSTRHTFAENYKNCRFKRCLWCGKVVKEGEVLHPAALCGNRPGSGKEAFLKALDDRGLLMSENGVASKTPRRRKKSE